MIRIPQRTAALALAAVGVTCSALWALAQWSVHRAAGLRLEVASTCAATSDAIRSRVVRQVQPEDVSPRDSCTRARWSGVWAVTRPIEARIKVATDGAAVLRIDGKSLGGDGARRAQAVSLAAGLHALEIEWTPPAESPGRLRILWAEDAASWQALDGARLFAECPRAAALWSVRLGTTFAFLALGAWVLALALAWRVRTRLGRPFAGLWAQARGLAGVLWRPPRARLAGAVLAALIVLYGAALRIEALRGGYWEEGAPRWVTAVARLAEAWRPHVWHWAPIENPYAGGDPGAYVRYGREMRGLYEPRVREPVFVLATKLGMLLANGRTVGVSVASTFFSILALWLTYLLGAYAFSRWVGLGAALALAVEWQAISQGVSGWRDEAFACFVLLVAWTALRLYDRGLFRDSVWLGLCGGLAWLTRITSPTLLLPVFAVLAIFPRSRPRRIRLERAGLAAFLAFVVAAPFLVNCMIAYGDPFYSINEHVVFYRTRSHMEYTHGMTVLDYLTKSFRPWQMADTLLIGFTEYPFAQKWSYGDWSTLLGPTLAGLAVVGLALWLALPRGRLLLFTHVAAMLPFAFTYEAIAGGPWRLTFHAYPFYLIAAFSAPFVVVRFIASRESRRAVREGLTLRRAAVLAAGTALVAVTGWTVWNGLYYMRFAEAVRAGERATQIPLFFAGTRDAFLFERGWYPSRRVGGLNGRYVRIPHGSPATLRLPLLGGRACRIVLGLDPYFSDAGRLPAIAVALNGRPLTTLRPEWNPERIGRYVIDVPANAARDGANDLTLAASPATPARDTVNRPSGVPEDWEIAFGLQHVAVRPSGFRPVLTRRTQLPESSAPEPARCAPESARPEE